MSGDLISRQTVLKIIDGWYDNNRDAENIEDLIVLITYMDPVNPQEPKTGHWEWLTEDKYRCSNCNHETRVDECMGKPMYDFCPFCGARMGSEDKE